MCFSHLVTANEATTKQWPYVVQSKTHIGFFVICFSDEQTAVLFQRPAIGLALP